MNHPREFGADLNMQDVLVYWESSLKQISSDNPERKSELISTLGDVCLSLNYYERALDNFQAAKDMKSKLFGPHDLNTLKEVIKISNTYMRKKKLSKAAQGYRTILNHSKDGSMLYLQALAGLTVIDLQTKGSEETIAKLQSISDEMFEIDPNSLERFSPLYAVAEYLDKTSKYAHAEQLWRDIHEEQSKLKGEDYPNTLTTLSNLANNIRRQGKYQDALPLYQKVYQSRKDSLGKNHPYLLWTQHGIGMCLNGLKRFEQAASYLQEAFEKAELLIGETDRQTLQIMNSFAHSVGQTENPHRAVRLYRELISRYDLIGPKDAHSRLRAVNNLAHYLNQTDQPEEALIWIDHCLELKRNKLDPQNSSVLHSMITKSHILAKFERQAEALALLKDVHELAETEGRSPGKVATLQSYYGEYLATLGRYEEAIEILKPLYLDLQQGTGREKEVKALFISFRKQGFLSDQEVLLLKLSD
jgi:tetratricopeptide (TPR) repeat protein